MIQVPDHYELDVRTRGVAVRHAAPAPVAAAARLRLAVASPHSDARGVELWIRLTRGPRPDAERIDDLIAGSVLRLPLELCSRADTPTRAGATYFHSVQFSLRDRRLAIQTANGKGERPAAVVTAILDRAATFEAVRALIGRSSTLDVQAVAIADETATPATVTTALADLARDAGGGLESWGRLLAPDPATGELRRVPNRSRGAAVRGAAALSRDVARFGAGFASINAVAALSPIESAPATAIAVHPSLVEADGRHHLAIAGQTRYPPPDRRPPHLPIVAADDDGWGLWPGADRIAPYWYLPSFSLVRPDPARPVQESPFTFRVTMSDYVVDGLPGLEATVTFTLRRGPDASIASQLVAHGNPAAHAAPFQNLAVSLSIPFRDSQGQLRRELFTAALVENGDTITATVSLLNNWARLAYGALAVDRFQSQPAHVQISGCFEGAEVLETNSGGYPVSLEPKVEVLPSPLLHRDGDGGVAFATPTGTIAFARSADQTRSTRPLEHAQVVAVHGQLHGQVLAAGRQQPLFAVDTHFRTQELPCLFPCDRFGAFYLEETDDGDVAIGCRDALKLGETEYRLYAPVEDARLPTSVRVYRSLLQPGRFLLVPALYKVARFDADAGSRAYHPAIFLYSSLDAASPANNRAALVATLGPAVAAHEVERIRELLRELSPSPILQFITEIPATVSYAWSLANGEVVRNQQAIRRWSSFQVSLSVDLEQAPLLQTMLETNGIAIVASFALPDGSTLTTALDLDLNGIVGPIGKTAAEVARVDGGATLTNRIDTTLDVDDLLVVDDRAAPGQPGISRLPVRKSLAPGESVAVAGDLPLTSRLVPVATPKATAATLEEIRSFVEDVITDLAFVNLVAFDNHNAAQIAIDARLKQTSDVYHVAIGATDALQVMRIVLPLTRYLAHPVVEFQATVTRRDGTTKTTAWIDWPLEIKGNVVGVSWELLGLTN